MTIARIRFWEPTLIGRAMLVDVPRDRPLRTEHGSVVDLARVTDRVSEAIIQKPADDGEVIILEGEPERAPTTPPLRAPAFELELPGSFGDSWRFRVRNTRRVSRGPLRTREVLQGPFVHASGRELAMLHVVHEVVFPGIQLCDVRFSNGVRAAHDVHGEGVDGELNFYHLLVDLPSRNHLCLFQDDTPFQHREETRVSLAQGVLTRRRRFRLRFAFCPEELEDAARKMLAFQDWGTVVEGHGYIDRGGYGPLDDHLIDFDTPDFEYRGNEGWEAVRHISRYELTRLQQQKEGSPYLLPTRGSKEGNDPGGTDIQPHMGHPQVPEWHHATALMSELYGNRQSLMLKPDGDPLDIWDVALANDGEQPWPVRRTNRAESKSATAIPWPSQVGHAWNEGTSAEESWQRSHADLDHAHCIRYVTHLVGEIWGANSEMAKLELEALVAHYQYDPTLFREDGNSIPRLKKSTPDWGDGALGRQIAWPMYAWASYFHVASPGWKRRNVLWRDGICAAVNRLCSPAGGNRKRLYPHWSWASPKPFFGPGEVADQVFEMCYVALASLAMAKTGNEDAREVFETIVRGLNGDSGDPRWRKFISYANQTTGLYAKPRDDSAGGSGSPHQGNLCGAAWLHFRDDAYLERAKRWLGYGALEDDVYVLTVLGDSGGWEGPQGHENTGLWWHANTLARVQQRMRTDDTGERVQRDPTA